MGACQIYRPVSLWSSYLVDPANQLLSGWSYQSAGTWLILPIGCYLVDPANMLLPGWSCQSAATWLIVPIGCYLVDPAKGQSKRKYSRAIVFGKYFFMLKYSVPTAKFSYVALHTVHCTVYTRHCTCICICTCALHTLNTVHCTQYIYN